MSDPHPGNDAGLHDPRRWLAQVGLSEREVPNILAAADLSRRRIRHARAALASLPAPGATAIALGSLGRHECSDGSPDPGKLRKRLRLHPGPQFGVGQFLNPRPGLGERTDPVRLGQPPVEQCNGAVNRAQGPLDRSLNRIHDSNDRASWPVSNPVCVSDRNPPG